jgi:hypothetical protein
MEQVYGFLLNFPPKYTDPYKCKDPLDSSNPFALQKPKVFSTCGGHSGI